MRWKTYVVLKISVNDSIKAFAGVVPSSDNIQLRALAKHKERGCVISIKAGKAPDLLIVMSCHVL